ncbi:hypothetical protein H4Q26_018024 [Puccinia striiformis f. sp. tritici PST-130]|nr:hypothetical protein H4Q26_018024 [Puccinia striiformis f. sp. tritici PST-130]
MLPIASRGRNLQPLYRRDPTGQIDPPFQSERNLTKRSQLEQTPLSTMKITNLGIFLVSIITIVGSNNASESSVCITRKRYWEHPCQDCRRRVVNGGYTDHCGVTTCSRCANNERVIVRKYCVKCEKKRKSSDDMQPS